MKKKAKHGGRKERDGGKTEVEDVWTWRRGKEEGVKEGNKVEVEWDREDS